MDPKNWTDKDEHKEIFLSSVLGVDYETNDDDDNDFIPNSDESSIFNDDDSSINEEDFLSEEVSDLFKSKLKLTF